MRKFILIPLIALVALAVSGCVGGTGIETVVDRFFTVGAAPTSQDLEKLGVVSKRFERYKVWVDKIQSDVSITIEADVRAEIVRLQDDADNKLEKLRKDPADHLSRSQINTVLTDLERTLLKLDPGRKHEVK